jgi:hypothetical protein
MSIAGSSFGNQTDVAATVRALERELLAYPGQQFRPCNPGGVVRPGLLMCVAAVAIRGLSANGPADSLPAGGGLGPLTNVPNGQRRDGPPQLVIRRKHPVIPMPVLPRRWDEVRWRGWGRSFRSSAQRVAAKSG